MDFPKRRLSSFSKLKNDETKNQNTNNKNLTFNSPLTHISISEKVKNKPQKEEMKENKENDIENENNELVKTIFYESNEKGIEENNSEFKFDNENHGFLNWFCCHKQNNSINNFEDNDNNNKLISCNIF